MSSDRAQEIGAEILAEAVPNPPPAKPRGRGRPKKLPKRIAAVIALKIEGYSYREIGKALGLKQSSVRQLVYQAKRLGGFSDVLDRVEGVAVPQAVENLIAGLADGDKDYTLETLKGRGVFRTHSQVKNEGGGGGGNTLLVKIEMPVLPAGASLPQVGEGAIVGAPRIIATPVPAVVPALPEPALDVLDAQKVVRNAVQVPSPAKVDPRHEPVDGEEVGGRDAGRGESARAPARPSIDDIAATFAKIAFAPRR